MNSVSLSKPVLLLVTIAISLATFIVVLDYSIANVSIPYISGDLAVSVDQGTYVITSFAVGNAIILPLTGWLTKRIGMLPLLTLSLLLFSLFSWLCGSSESLEFLVVSRLLQGAVAGPLIPLSQSLLLEIYPPEKKNTAMGFWSTIVITAPILGPILGGWLSYDYTWPWIFYINVPIGIFCALVLKVFLRSFKTPIEKPPTDWVALILLTIGVSCLQICLDKGQQFDWLNSPLIRVLGASSVISFILLIVWELYHETPLLELKLFKINTFATSVFLLAISYAVYFGTIVLIPLWLQTNMNYDAIWAGFAVAPLGIPPLFLSTFCAKNLHKTGKILPLVLSFSFFSFSCFYTAFFDTDVDFFHIALSRFFLGCGIIFYITPLLSLSIQDISTDKLPSATGIFHFVRAMVGGIGTSVFTTLWIRRGIFHHFNIASTVNDTSTAIEPAALSLQQQGLEGKSTFAFIETLANNQAAMLSLNDCFYLMGWLCLLLIFFLPIARTKKASHASFSLPQGE